MQRQVASGCLVVLVLLSGCSGLFGGGGAPVVTPGNTSGMPADHPEINGSSGGMPSDHPSVNQSRDWTNESQITDGAALIRAHAGQLLGTGFEIQGQYNQTDANGTVNQSIATTSDVRTRELRSTVHTGNATRYRYQNDSRVYSKAVRANGTTYRVQNVSANFLRIHQNAAQLQSLGAILDAGNYTRVDRFTRSDERFAEYTLRAASAGQENVTIENASGRILVDNTGLVHSGTATIRGRNGDAPFHYYIEYRVSATGNVTITPPSWLDEARAAAE